MSKREFEEGERAQVEAHANVSATKQAIEEAGRIVREAEEVVKLTNSGTHAEAARKMTSLEEQKIVGTP